MSDKPKVTFKKIKDSPHIIHPDTKLVLKSSSEKIVIGHRNDTDVIPYITEEMVKLCKKWNFIYDESCVKEEEEEEDEQEEEGENEPEETEKVEEQPGEKVDEEKVDEEKVDEEKVDEEKVDEEKVDEEKVDEEPELVQISSTCPKRKAYFEEQQKFIALTNDMFSELHDSNNEKDNQISKLRSELSEITTKYNELQKKFDMLKGLLA